MTSDLGMVDLDPIRSSSQIKVIDQSSRLQEELEDGLQHRSINVDVFATSMAGCDRDL